ncbi:putative manganese-dependent inorganic diphosphatase [Luteolibacter ambystomatis]|uniref:inorganic diphosphatase n=1 Tax=Luteolibacter ambystomatis TaxID=2824561 RepID=A0A975G9V8_9BACT|nr:putative manganese-dependent inorganic diphosphatase [Luteolibacter ambystomatis]QUE51410.1 putative manganese-dependent inorganic diphosphatase [Luteolibacter ambystomatis]
MSDRTRLPFYVIGHKNPDTDAICSAIGHAALLRATGEEDATAARCGDVPQRTAWVLEKAGMEAPELVTDVRTTAGMICRREVIQADLSDTFLIAYRRMLSSGVRCVPVTDATGHVHGILRYIDLLELLLPNEAQEMAFRTVRASFLKIADTLGAESLGAPISGEDEEDIILLVGASSQNSVNARLKSAAKEGRIGRVLVICGDRPIVQRYAIEAGARALLVTGDNLIDPALTKLAAEKGVVVLTCHHDTASCSTLIRCSRTVRHVMETKFITVVPSEPMSRLRKRLASEDQDLFPVIDPREGTMKGVISKSDLVDPPRLRVALVDHNEYAQAVNGVEEAEVVEVIDHHRLAGDLVSREPIRYLNEPVGSTSTLVARKFVHRGLAPESGVAMCLSAGIISDTLCLTGPTTTDLDREMLKWLTGIAGIEAETFTEQFFAVGSLIATGTAGEILNADRKEFTDDGHKVSISQVEERGLHGFGPRREEVETALRQLVISNGYNLAVLAVTDVSRHHSIILAAGDPDILAKLPFAPVDETLFDAPGVVSRKKQIFPAVSEALQHAK